MSKVSDIKQLIVNNLSISITIIEDKRYKKLKSLNFCLIKQKYSVKIKNEVNYDQTTNR